MMKLNVSTNTLTQLECVSWKEVLEEHACSTLWMEGSNVNQIMHMILARLSSLYSLQTQLTIIRTTNLYFQFETTSVESSRVLQT